ncbi:MAG: PIN domain-containing protein [Acidobacteriota bacterium]
MIYLDTSVALAWLFAEDRVPADGLWFRSLVSSRLIEYEIWVHANARGLAASHGDSIRGLIDRLALVELTPTVLARAVEPFPAEVRTLDALHLATCEFLRSRVRKLELATYDGRMMDAARGLGIQLHDPLKSSG